MQKINYNRKKHYEFGNKPSKLLACQLKRTSRKEKAIHFKSNITYHPKEINQAFQEYYSTRYKSKSNYTQDELEHYLENVKLPKLSESDQQSLNTPFTEQEILAAINSMPIDKSPGPDGILAQLYKEYWTDLKPIFMSTLFIIRYCHKQ